MPKAVIQGAIAVGTAEQFKKLGITAERVKEEAARRREGELPTGK